MSDFSIHPGRSPEDEALRELLRTDEPAQGLPAWFTARLLHEVRRERRAAEGGRWFAWFAGMLRPRFLGPALMVAAGLGAWSGYRGAQQEALHLAEVRYVDEVDPVHAHP